MRPGLALAAVLIAAVALLSREGPEVGAGAAAPRALPAVAGGRLVLVDPRSLRMLPGGGVRLDAPVEGWAAAPGSRLDAPVEGWAAAPGSRLDAPVERWAAAPGSRLAVVTDGGSVVRLFDVARMRALGRVRLGARGEVAAVGWPEPGRLWVVLARPGCCAIGSTTVVTVDPLARRVVGRRRLADGLARVGATPDGPVLLLAPSGVIGPATLAAVRPDGRIDRVPIDGMSAGVQPTEGVPFVEHVRTPALAVDPRGRRAYVISSRPHVVEVHLRRLAVRHHRLAQRTSLLERLRELVEPAASASPEVGRVRSAAWIGAGRIALSGRDGHLEWRAGGAVRAGRTPAGLRLIDTREWTVGTVDEHAAGFHVAGGLVLAGGRGLSAYAPDGRGVLRVLGDRRVRVVAGAGPLAYVRTPPATALRIVDLERGSVAVAPRRPRLLLEDAPRAWGP